MAWPATVSEWGSTAEERARAYPCDRLLADAERELFRAVDVAAPERLLLPPGDLVMMRRQLLNLKRLAERDAQ